MQSIVPVNAVAVRGVKVVSVEPFGTIDVYNMEVETTHNFAVAKGLIIHNCFDESRYRCNFKRHSISPVRIIGV